MSDPSEAPRRSDQTRRAKRRAYAIRLLATLIGPCPVVGDHEWRTCRRCGIFHELQARRNNLAMRLLRVALRELEAAPSLSGEGQIDQTCPTCGDARCVGASFHALRGSWGPYDIRRAFVDGARWWEFVSRGATMWASDRARAEQEADRRYAAPSLAGEDAKEVRPVDHGRQSVDPSVAVAPLSLAGEDGATETEVQIAERIARAAHASQVEESTGDPYIRHVERVVAMVEGDEAQAVAWLHDVLEDSAWTPPQLQCEGISDPVIDAVLRLTRTSDTYERYIELIQESGDALALAVKIADLRDHLRPNCPGRLRPRYEQALKLLAGEALPMKETEEDKARSEAMTDQPRARALLQTWLAEDAASPEVGDPVRDLVAQYQALERERVAWCAAGRPGGPQYGALLGRIKAAQKALLTVDLEALSRACPPGDR